MKDTPLKKSVRQLHENWVPLYGGSQPTPPYREMRHAAQNYDNTSFDVAKREYYLPKEAPTGRGAAHDSSETANYVSRVLRRIHPAFSNLYLGGHSNEDHHLVQTNRYQKAHVRAGPLGGLKEIEHKYTTKVTVPEDESYNHNLYRPMQIFEA